MLRFADLLRDEDLVIAAQREARALVADDPEIGRPEHRRIRELLEERYSDRLDLYGVG